jgi:cyclopropane-fatty-acyl-phospholipid synthase
MMAHLQRRLTLNTSTKILDDLLQVVVCPICKNTSIDIVASLPNYPVTEFFSEASSRPVDIEIGYDQSLLFCLDCKHSYLGFQLQPKLIYNISYQTLASDSSPAQSATLRFLKVIDQYKALKSFDLVMDIGANDGSLLRQLDLFNFKGSKVALDPSFEDWDKDVLGFTGFVEDFDIDMIPKVQSPRLFVASHVLEHIAMPAVLLEKLSKFMKKNDVAVFQFPCFETLNIESRFDQIHHQHFHYFSHTSFMRLLDDYDLELSHSRIDWKHYGAALVFLTKRETGKKTREKVIPVVDDWQALTKVALLTEERIKTSYEHFKNHLSFVRSQLEASSYIALGAGLMSPVIFYHLRDVWLNCEFILDENQSKWGKRYANTPCEIRPFSESINSKIGLVTGSVSRLAGRELVKKSSELELDRLIIPVTTI